MNKLVTVLGVAAVATLAGCKDPNYKSMSAPSQDEVKVVEPTPAPVPQPVPQAVPAKPTCKCPPGTKHASPCTCGAPDCQCIVEVKPVVLPPPPVAAPEYTTYIVQNGDYLAKISKKYNVTIGSIKRLNGMKSDTVRVGQKLKLPGKIDIGVQSAPVKAETARKVVARSAAEYKGATKEYVVKNGDTLGAIAYGNGCNIRQLKKMNNLTSDSLKIGQKLKVPADGKAAVSAPEKAKTVAAKPAEAVKPVDKSAEPAAAEPKVEPAATPAPAAPADAAAAPAAAAPAAPAPAAEPATTTYVVQEADDMTGVSIRFGVTAAAIRELNNLAEDAQLTPGQVIKLPADTQQ